MMIKNLYFKYVIWPNLAICLPWKIAIFKNMFLWVIATFATSNNLSMKIVQESTFQPYIEGTKEVWCLHSSMCPCIRMASSFKLPTHQMLGVQSSCQVHIALTM
jgi:hypothetical protein